MTKLIEDYQFGQAGTLAYEFLWGEYCDWYLETAKLTLYGSDEAAKARVRSVLLHVLDTTLRLLHPFIPFVTEELWSHLPKREGEAPALIVAAWPQPGPSDEQAERDYGLIMEIVRGIRNARAENNVKPGQKIAASLVAGADAEMLKAQRATLASLAGLEDAQFRIFDILPEKPAARNAVALIVRSVECFLPLAGLVDFAAEKARLTKELEEADKQIARSESLLSGDFANKAPAPVVEKERAKLAGLKESRAKLAERLAALK